MFFFVVDVFDAVSIFLLGQHINNVKLTKDIKEKDQPLIKMHFSYPIESRRKL